MRQRIYPSLHAAFGPSEPRGASRFVGAVRIHDGLPIGLQIMGKPFEEQWCCAPDMPTSKLPNIICKGRS
jgi:hypothetical protein